MSTIPNEIIINKENKIPQKTNNKKKYYKDKKYNGYLRNTNRKIKEDEDLIINEDNKEQTFEPESLLFSHLRQKTGLNPIKFWENFHLLLKNKNFIEIKKGDMNLISYSALYESIEIFKTLINEYGHLVPQQEIETSIFKLSTNKNPLILYHAINFYNQHYTPSEQFINDFFKLAAKDSYREEANQLVINWLAPKMSDNNKKEFWEICLKNKNVSFINLALMNLDLNTYLKIEKLNFSELINKTGREYFINSSLSTKIINEHNKLLPKIEESNVIDIYLQTNKSNNLNNTNINDAFIEKNSGPQIIIKKKRKIL